uniref:(California timema) hypothetical protein n=1 Tax=Timema californicum TaxID=61474 RepID=A0A7R9J6K4_TIMCA|nr:unnamed protein product [Timema californicum]
MMYLEWVDFSQNSRLMAHREKFIYAYICASHFDASQFRTPMQDKLFFEIISNSNTTCWPTSEVLPMCYGVEAVSNLSGAEIISIDAFTKSKSSDDFVIGITIIKCGNNEHSHETYLHIYSEWEPSSEFNMESAAQNCQMLELDFIPYQLYHTELLTGLETDDNNEVVWLLSGSDEKVHLFREDRLNHCYIKAETEDYFPELSRAPSIVMWMDVHHTSDYAQRVTAFGCECGYVKLTVINVPRNEIISDCSIRFESSVTSVALFNDELKLRCPSFINLTDVSPADEEEPSLHLLVTTTLQPAVIYRNITVQGFESCYNLPDSDSFDAVMCCLVADIDMDGKQEVILGTYGQEMLVYKLESSSEDGKESWQLNCQRGFSNPIYSLLYVDVTGDGVKELVVLTLQGVHIMQHDFKFVEDKLSNRLLRPYLQPGRHSDNVSTRLTECQSSKTLGRNLCSSISRDTADRDGWDVGVTALTPRESCLLIQIGRIPQEVGNSIKVLLSALAVPTVMVSLDVATVQIHIRLLLAIHGDLTWDDERIEPHRALWSPRV